MACMPYDLLEQWRQRRCFGHRAEGPKLTDTGLFRVPKNPDPPPPPSEPGPFSEIKGSSGAWTSDVSLRAKAARWAIQGGSPHRKLHRQMD